MNVLFRLSLALFLIAATFWPPAGAAAQDGGVLLISVPDTSDFPLMRLYLNAYDAQGGFLENLTEADFRIRENGSLLEPAGVDLLQNGVQFIVALNTSPSMATQTGGITGFQHLQNALTGWASQQPVTSQDDVSLSTPTGLYLIRERNSEEVVRGFSEYQPDLLSSQITLSSLAEALDLATDPLDHPLKKRAILFITPPLPNTDSATIEDLTSRAKSTGVRVHIWLVVQAGSQPAANPLQQIADATGGQFQEIVLGEPLPEIEPLLQPLRQTYEIRYHSAIQKSGMHQTSVEVISAQQNPTSNEVRFRLEVSPPNPIFLEPPATVERSWTGVTKSAEPALTPEEVPLQILIEFPDQHPREIQAARLYVDETLVAENTSAPFDRFNWSLEGVGESGRHTLRAEVVDTLGLSGSSIEIPVEIIVKQPATAEIGSRVSNRGIIALGAVGAAGAVLALVLVFSNNRRMAGRKRQQVDKKLLKDPVTQPVNIRQEPARAKKDKSGPARGPLGWAVWPHIGSSETPARLIILDENEEPITGGTISLSRQEITFGTDPRRATQVLESPTVDGLHARLYRQEDGNYYLADQGSIAGTWINYAPVSTSGARLEHGDLIHIGKVMFRFELTTPERLPVAEIEVLDPER